MLVRKAVCLLGVAAWLPSVLGLALSLDESAASVACARNPKLPYCRAFASRTVTRDRSEDREKDAMACKELRLEYRNSCTRDKRKSQNDEFCAAYENVCFRIPSTEPDQPVVPTRPPGGSGGGKRATTTTEEPPAPPPPPKKPKKDYTEFCREYKQRFLYVCPDPFRFGQRAAVFCPIYSERCHIPVPEKPVLPTQRPPVSPISEAIQNRQRVCAQYRGFAASYCGNPFALQQPNIRDGCAKYRRWCTRSGR